MCFVCKNQVIENNERILSLIRRDCEYHQFHWFMVTNPREFLLWPQKEQLNQTKTEVQLKCVNKYNECIQKVRLCPMRLDCDEGR